jgi:hypothetical protein
VESSIAGHHLTPVGRAPHASSTPPRRVDPGR